MKTYTERLPLIDASIEYNEGRFWDTQRYFILDDGIMYKRGATASRNEEVCTRTEFESRARELGWVNRGKTEPSVKFIADQMKILTPNGEYRDMRELIEEELNKMHNNDWYKKSELPPVGAELEYVKKGSAEQVWWACKVIAHDDGAPVVKTVVGRYHRRPLDEYTFRPILTERDSLVASAEATFESSGCVFTTDHRAVVESLIDAGWRPVKQQSEDEFIKDATIKGFLDYGQLYRAGCRFLDMGDEI